MKFNEEALRALLAQDDAQLWHSIQSIAAQRGLRLSEQMPAPADMARLRDILSGARNMSISEALRILGQYRS